ncbi:MAG TPA: hypothetical protein VHL53_09875 [Acidimicrobiia bacterium]|nr:hypothetical protein [Acidimicrobiia bacterium]
MGPITFVVVFLVVPLAVALCAGLFFAAVGLVRLLGLVPTGAWATLTVVAAVAIGTRLVIVLRTLRPRSQ